MTVHLKTSSKVRPFPFKTSQRPALVQKAMSNKVEKIVDTYVQLNDGRALGDLRRYRQELSVLLKAQTGLDFSLLIGQIDAEIAVIEAGLDRLRHTAHSA
jgi:capsule polysaccharide export protein KpsE/RkpR